METQWSLCCNDHFVAICKHMRDELVWLCCNYTNTQQEQSFSKVTWAQENLIIKSGSIYFNFSGLERLSMFSDGLFGFLNLIREGVGWGSSSSQRPLPTEDNTANIHACSGIQTRNSSNKAAKTYASFDFFTYENILVMSSDDQQSRTYILI
jgi:hypothetical protein